jgi:hypothetical protein
MSEEKETKERISDVLAWFGFGYPIALALAGMYGRDALEPLGGGRSYDFSDVIVSAMVFGGCATLNYLITGKPRFVPWNGEVSPETKANLKSDLKMLCLFLAIMASLAIVPAVIRTVF